MSAKIKICSSNAGPTPGRRRTAGELLNRGSGSVDSRSWLVGRRGLVGGLGRSGGFRGYATAIRSDNCTTAIGGLTAAATTARATTDVTFTTFAACTAFAPSTASTTRAAFAPGNTGAAIATKAATRITTAGDRSTSDIATVTGYRTVTPIAAVTGYSLLLTTQQGDPDDREK